MTEQNADATPKKSRLPLYLSLLLITILVICYLTVPSVNQFFQEAWNVLSSDDEARIKSWVEGFGWFGPALIVLAMVVQMFLLVIPTLVLMLVAVLAYGPIWGSVISFFSVVIASTIGYSIGRQLGTAFIARLLGENSFGKVRSFLKKYGFWAVAITRVNPFLSNDAISFASGILKMNYWKFSGATILGILPLIFLIAIAGKNINSLKNGLLWGSIGCLLIFVSYAIWDKRGKKTKKNGVSSQ